MKTLEQQITKRGLLALAGRTIYERGEDYAAVGAVISLRVIRNTSIATVAGSSFDDYKIVLTPGPRSLDYECSCPMGEEGGFCKHVVATGLVWLEHGAKSGARRKPPALTDDTGPIRDYLLTQPKEALADLLLEQCVRDEKLHESLKQQATSVREKSLKKPPTRRIKTETTKK
ncbi:MAG TPA: SWIM zinc finger family protein [Gammaproteobacteria bacterium]|nr:SWIM zinc finger family protein [Gammaproteobacteria bacterium]